MPFTVFGQFFICLASFAIDKPTVTLSVSQQTYSKLFLHHIPVLDVVIYSKIFQNWRYTFKLTEHSSV